MGKYYEDLEKVWGLCCNNTFLKRKDWGSFLKINPDEIHIIEQIKNGKLT